MTASVWTPDSQVIPQVNANSTIVPQVFSPTAGQTVFTITNFVYVLGTHSLLVLINGVFQLITKDFNETSTNSFTLTTTEVLATDQVVALGFVGVSAAITNTAANISYGGSTLADYLLNHTDYVVTSFTALRATQHIFWQFAYVTGAVVSGDGSGGFYYYDPTDTTSADNGASIIVAADGGRWKLILQSAVTPAKGDNTAAIATAKFVQQSHVSALTHMIHPSVHGRWNDFYKSGLRPGFHNQQWGGGIAGYELLDNATDNVITFDSLTGLVEDSVAAGMTTIGTKYLSQAIKVGENCAVQAIWICLSKSGNPVDFSILTIFNDDGTGKPSGFVGITNGSSNIINNRQITTDTTKAEWYRFVFPTPPTLLQNVQYHFALTRTGAVDATNFILLRLTGTSHYPFGLSCTSDGTTWTKQAASPVLGIKFLLEPVITNQFFQPTGGLVDPARLVFSEGVPLAQSKVLVDQLVNYHNDKLFTQLLRISNAVMGKTIADIGWGMNHDRINISCDLATGYLRVAVYTSTKALVQLVSNITVVAVTLVDVAVIVRTMNDGADYIQIWINGVLNTSTAGLSINMSPFLKQVGTRWIGGGFPVSPAWSQDMNMTSLPSAQGWSWIGTATEANAMSILGNKLIQNAAGYSATDTGYYTRGAGFNNVTGWIVSVRVRIVSATGPIGTLSCCIVVHDGTKAVTVNIQDYFLNTGDYSVQFDPKLTDNVITICGKGIDYYVFSGTKLIIDGSGKLLSTTAFNSIDFGDTDATSGAKSDVIWSDLKFYAGGMVVPTISTGMSLHEAGYFSGDQSAYLPALYNAGVPISIKNFWYQSNNYVTEIPWTIRILGITFNPSTNSTTPIKVMEMESYVLGNSFEARGTYTFQADSSFVGTATILVDGKFILAEQANLSVVNGPFYTLPSSSVSVTYIGMHKIEQCMSVSSGNQTGTLSMRQLYISSGKSKY